ncbi:WXG100 family type VII secretion target [Oerskovia flava]|uniref:WXG100 family type VII secretion target n=1 Tax=Oerskovia flava TaxID=2986422 RepID=UPI00223EEF19|nr:WXG100 family type VII secretion target [Oerskovia sp. JB1-3-2]
MAGMWGLDVEQVRQLSVELNSKSGEIETIASTLTSRLASTAWEGPDATRFRDDWQSIHLTALNNVSQALAEAGNRAQQNAAEQESTSNAG